MGVNLKRIKAYRVYNEIGQEEMAEKLGISIASYSYKEQGRREFTSSEVGKIAKAFDIPVGDLFSNDNQLL